MPQCKNQNALSRVYCKHFSFHITLLRQGAGSPCRGKNICLPRKKVFSAVVIFKVGYAA